MVTRVVLIGAHGRIGTAAGAALVERGHEVLGLARDPDPHAAPFPVRPLRLADPSKLAADLTGAEVVVYCAGAHHGAEEAIHELGVFEVNVVAALRAALAAMCVGAQRFVYLSSTAVSGTDVDNVRRPGTYVRSKRLAEVVLTAAVAARLTIVRLGWVIDPGDEVAHQRLWPSSGRQVIVGGLPVPMVGLSDVAAAITLMARRDSFDHADLFGTIDLVSGCPTQAQLYELARSLRAEPLRIVDARTATRLAALSRRSIGDATWLSGSRLQQQASEPRAFWASHGLTLTSWQDCVRALKDEQEVLSRAKSVAPKWTGHDDGSGSIRVQT